MEGGLDNDMENECVNNDCISENVCEEYTSSVSEEL